MTGFLDIQRVLVPREIVLEGQRFLTVVGQRRMEGIALWVGVREDDTFLITDLLIPRQRGVSGESGLCAVIEGDELARIGRELYAAGKLLFAQLHTHPTEAYHSSTDDEFSIVTKLGGLSLVIPDFAVRPFNLDDCAVYRLNGDGLWAEMTPDQASAFIRIVGD